jgi:uncharacterized protein
MSEDPAIEPPSQPRAVKPLPDRPKPFSVVTILICAVLALGLFLHRNWQYLTVGHAARLSDAESTALWALHETMLFQDGFAKLPDPAKAGLTLLALNPWNSAEDCEEMLRDTIQHISAATQDPRSVNHLRANLVILLAEHGTRTNALKELALLAESKSAAEFRHAFSDAYGTNVITGGDSDPPELLTGWAGWRYSTRLLETAGKSAELKDHLDAVAYGEAKLLWPVVGMFTLAGLVQVSGLICLIILAIKKPFWHPAQAPLQGPNWCAREYWGLFTVGFLLGLVAENLAMRAPFFSHYAWLTHCLIWGAPVVLLMAGRHWLWQPDSFLKFFGVPTRLVSAAWLSVAGIALFCLCWLVVVWVPTLVDVLGFKSHWAESYDEVLRTWSWDARLLHLLDGIIFGPVLEEIIYRGLLFAALRKHLPLYPAALLSALIFGGTHFYSLAGFLSVSTFGFLSAISREKTGSLLPSMFAHVLTNFFLFGMQALVGVM